MDESTKRYLIRRSVPLLMSRMVLALVVVDLPFVLILAIVLASQAVFSPFFLVIALFILYGAKSILLGYLAYNILAEWASTSYFISGTMLVYTEGVMDQTEHLIDLKGIQAVEAYQDWAGHLFNFGEIVLIAREHIRLRGIENPHHYEEVIRSFMEK